MFDLTNRVAIITGAASGIGAATARVFAAAGADLALAWYPPDGHDIELVRRDVEALGRKCVVEAIDVTSTSDVARLTARAVDELGAVHVVVANAGVARTVSSEALDDEAWNLVVNVDLHGVWRVFRECIPHMKRQGFGRLITTSSVAGTVSGWPEHSHYAAAKGGLVGLVKSLAVELGPFGITANAVAPGVIRTPQALDPVNSLGPEALEAVGPKVPVGRVGTPEDIAYVYQFLASDEASYVSGELIVVDGARSLAGLD
ncbi:MAG TPA: SDR family oxidoreductase [Acidimicrobiales bacterium]